MRHVQRDRMYFHLTRLTKVAVFAVQLFDLDIVLYVFHR